MWTPSFLLSNGWTHDESRPKLDQSLSSPALILISSLLSGWGVETERGWSYSLLSRFAPNLPSLYPPWLVYPPLFLSLSLLLSLSFSYLLLLVSPPLSSPISSFSFLLFTPLLSPLLEGETPPRGLRGGTSPGEDWKLDKLDWECVLRRESWETGIGLRVWSQARALRDWNWRSSLCQDSWRDRESSLRQGFQWDWNWSSSLLWESC